MSLALGLVLVATLAPADGVVAQCVTTGGARDCTQLQPKPWADFTACDAQPPSATYEADWCQAFGGTGGTNCSVPLVFTEQNLVEKSQSFASIEFGCGAIETGDSGWTITHDPTGYCASGTPVTSWGFTSKTYRELQFANTCPTPPAVNIFASKQRGVICPAGYSFFGGTPPSEPPAFCAHFPSAVCEVADPVRLLDNQLIEWQEDFPRTDGGLLHFKRVYHSSGTFVPAEVPHSPDVSPPSFWQSNFDVRLYALDQTMYSVPYIVVDTDAKEHYFNASGVEVVHYSGNAAEQLLVQHDAGGNVSAYVRVMSNDDRQTFSPNGSLIAWDDTRGHHLALVYNATGQLSTVTDEKGRSLTVAFNAAGLLSSVTDSAGDTVAYGYDSVGNLTTVTYPGGATRTYRYENSSRPYAWTGITDENSANYAAFTYGADGTVSDTVHAPNLAGGTIEHYSLYIASGSAVFVTEPLQQGTGKHVTYYLTLANNVVNMSSVSQPCQVGCGGKTVQSRSYDAAGYYASSTDFNGKLTTYTYDDTRGLETQRVEAYGTPSRRTTNTTWNSNFRVPDQRTVLNASGVTESMTKWAYNSRGQTTARCQIDPAVSGATSYSCGSSANAPTGVRQWTYTYCDAVGTGCPLVGLLLTVDGPRTDVSDVTTYAYYASTDLSGCTTLGGVCHNIGDLQSVTNALGQVTTYVSYDKNGRVTRIKDANNVYTDMTYHARGWLLTRTVRANADGTPNASLDATTTFAYDNVGNVTQVTQPDGTYLHYVYDAAHRLTDIYDSATPANYLQGNHIHYTLDAVGNRTDEKTTDTSGTLKRELSRTYDQLNRLTSLLNSANAAVQTYTNPAEAPPSGVTYTDGYDGNGNAIYSIDGTSNHVGTEQQYDPLNRLVKTLQDHAGTGATHDTSTQYAYDTRDNLRSVTDPDGLVTSYTYDGLNNLTDLNSPDTGHTGYTYDAAGNRATQTDARNITSTYSYDALNRLTGISYPTTSLNVAYAYDQAANGCYNTGRLTKITDSSGNTTYCYDSRGNVLSKVQVTNGVTLTTLYGYSLADRLATITYPSDALVSYSRDTVGRISAVSYTPSGGSTTTLVSGASYFPYGPLNVLTFGNGRVLTKTYDADYAIDKVVSSDANGLIVDAAVDVLGNLRNASSAVGATPPTQQYGYDPLYRLTSVQDGSGSSLLALAYDATGDRTSKTPQGQAAQAYTYTTNTHHLASVAGSARSYDAAGNTTGANSTTFAYDDRNRMSSAAGMSYNYNGRGERVYKSNGTLFAYAENGQLAGEYNISGQAQKEYIWLDGTPVGVAAGGTLYYIETDQLGTPRQVIQPGATTASDTTVWKWDYFANNSAFGENTPSVQTITFNLRFPGQYYDSETGLNYNYFRDYEAGTGRYVESDPVGIKGGLGTYLYANDRPYSYIDPFGLDYGYPDCSPDEKPLWSYPPAGGKDTTPTKSCIPKPKPPPQPCPAADCEFNCELATHSSTRPWKSAGVVLGTVGGIVLLWVPEPTTATKVCGTALLAISGAVEANNLLEENAEIECKKKCFSCRQ